MSGHHIPPAVIAQTDQFRAAADHRVDLLVAAIREHIAAHDGSTDCAYRTVILQFIRPGAVTLVETLTSALVRLAELEAGDRS